METATSNMPIQQDQDRDVSTMNQTQNPILVTNQITSIQQEEEQYEDALTLNRNPNGVMSNPTAEDETTESQNSGSDIPMDIISDILKRLPAKTLVQCKCVCKPWESLLTDSTFIKSHLKRNQSMFQSDLKTNTRLILSRYCDTLLSTVESEAKKNCMQAEELDFPLLKNLPYYVKGHSDGLLCLVVNDGDEGMLVIYNPSIHQYRKLPNPADFRNTKEAIGFGFDKRKDDYKLVRVPSNYCSRKVPGYKRKVEVLELKENIWREIPDEDVPPYNVEHVFQSTEVNGGLYWLVEDDRTLDNLILRFDLVEEKFKVVPPPEEEFSRKVTWIGPLKDLLCVVHTRMLSEVHVWGTKDDMTWRKIATNSKHPEPPEPNAYYDTFQYMPLCYTEKGALLMSDGEQRFLTFDNSENQFETVKICDAKRWLQETMYCESLVSPGVGVHQTEAAANSGSSINYLTAEDEAEGNVEAGNSSSVLRIMSSLKKELVNLLACTVGLGSRHAQG